MTSHQKITDQLVSKVETAIKEHLPEGVGYFFILAPYAKEVDTQKECVAKASIDKDDMLRILQRVVSGLQAERN